MPKKKSDEDEDIKAIKAIIKKMEDVLGHKLRAKKKRKPTPIDTPVQEKEKE